MGNNSSSKKDGDEGKPHLKVQENKNVCSSTGGGVISPIDFWNSLQRVNSNNMAPGIFNQDHNIATTIAEGETVEVFSPESSYNRDEKTPFNIPIIYLNKLGFVNYNHYGSVPWPEDRDVFIPKEYKGETQYLGIDCEMVGVGHLKDSALGRVSIVNEYGFCIYDRFVKPKGEISDYRTEFSGIRHEDLVHAHSMDRVIRKVKEIVDGKILVGHSIHNDLEVLELNDHPQNMIRDTSIFFQKLLESKQTPSLKSLTSKYLGIDIQDGEHSSIQDAQATLKLYLMHRSNWEQSLIERREKANLNNLNFTEHLMDPPVDITEMNVCPREKDVFADSKTIFVRENRIVGAYSSSEEYKDVQFRLLLEDLFRPLRQGVSVAKQYGRSGRNRNTPKAGTLFNGIRIQGDNVEVKGNKVITVPIERNNLTNVDWEETKLFMNGSLLLLSPDNFRTIKFATITWRPKKDTESFYSIPLAVTFSKDGPSWITKEGDSFQMMESVAFYEAYKHTLQYLQIVKLDSFPLKKYIVDAVMQPSLPKYLQNPHVHFDFSVFLKNNASLMEPVNYHTALPLEFNKWPSSVQLGLDPSQYEAFQKALTQEMTIIQGPPGTGKTFIGIQVVKFLLSNSSLLKSPILIVAYTNHALDQVLEGLLKFVTKEMCDGNEFKAHRLMLRIGGGCKSEIVEPMLLRYKIDKNKERKRLEGQLTKLQIAIKKVKPYQNALSDGILDFLQLPFEVTQELAIRCNDVWKKWKNEHNSIKKDPSNWLGISKNGTSSLTNNKRKKNPLILLPFCEYALGSDLWSVVHATLQQENLENVWDEKSLPNLLLVAFETKAPVMEQNIEARWVIYLYLAHTVKNIVQQMVSKANKLQTVVLEQQRQGIEGRNGSIKSARVIGMTTTGAVKYKKMVVKSFKSQVMIVEEAAHVLEAHVVASLTEHCQQMIMIGDHKQLRPMTADNSLAKNYKLEVSMMERLVENGIFQGKKNWVQLKLQHRMRPEIAQMVCPVIYEELDNHPDVSLYPDVKGCAKNIFFIDHSMVEEREHRSSSRINHHEASFLSHLCQYFITKCGYDPSQITVIATYLDQKTLLQKRLAHLVGCADVRISTVDGYQGEENDIILLSLVRSNNENIVGFLKTDNRVCVALSRARHGLFMMGNMSCLKPSSETWSKINNILHEGNNIGPRLCLKCSIHGHRSEVSKAVDFLNISCPGCIKDGILNKLKPSTMPIATINGDREGESQYSHTHEKPAKFGGDSSVVRDGYTHISKNHSLPLVTINNTKTENENIDTWEDEDRKPSFPTVQPADVSINLPCGHDYTGKPKRTLDTVKCITVVKKKLPCRHIQKAPCHQSKESIKCASWVWKPLPCGHNQQVPCDNHESFDPSKIICKQLVQKTLACGIHSNRVPCNQTASTSKKCMKELTKILPCGHHQKMQCSKNDAKIKCQFPVLKILPCKHELKAECHIKESKIKCQKQVWICLDHKKKVACHQRVQNPCSTPITKIMQCGHELEVPCYKKDVISKPKCLSLVLKTLSCGHKQMSQCHIHESKITCNQGTDVCEHLINIPCLERSGKICSKIVNRTLLCGHVAEVPCSKKLTDIKCIASAWKFLPCGHRQLGHCHLNAANINCHVQVSGCINHQKVICYKRSEIGCSNLVVRLLQCGHEKAIPCLKSLRDLSEVKCTFPVSKPLSCGHQQTGPCYFDKSNMICSVPVIGCKDHRKVTCYEKSGITCVNPIIRRLPCGHEQKVQCGKKLSEIKCVFPVKKTLPCGHSQKPQCYLANQLKCNHMDNKNLPCGHKYQKKILCGQQVPQVQCKILVSVTLQCKHKILVECHKKERLVVGFHCNSQCNKKFKCGHFCRRPCHPNDNPTHEQRKCIEKCCRSCPKGHPCPADHECHTGCKVTSGCPVECKATWKCGHFQIIPCHETVAVLETPCKMCVNTLNQAVLELNSTIKSLANFKI